MVTGRYFKWRRELRANPATYDTGLQDALLAAYGTLTGVRLRGWCRVSRSPSDRQGGALVPGGHRGSPRLRSSTGFS
jgi:hypothetical protein